MANKTQTIRIESILGGQSPTTHFAAPDQFRASLGVDPGAAIDINYNTYSTHPGGILQPVGITGSSNTTLGSIMWLEFEPKNGVLYAYDSRGSIFTGTNLTGLGDLNDGGNAYGNGMAYYDNYMYFATSTTVARYGPLNGTPSFTDNYWVGTLGKTALTNPDYPEDFTLIRAYPNHVMHRHSDGKLYFADVVDGQGTLHYIKTTKTTVEGDTDNGSKYDALNFGYGLFVTDMESYEDFLVISLIEIDVNQKVPVKRAKVAFWDTTSENPNKITWVEFPDPLLTAVKNANGKLYFISGHRGGLGFRVSRYIGGNSFEEIHFSADGFPSFPGAVDAVGERLFFGSNAYTPAQAGCVYSLGLFASKLSTGLFNIMRSRSVSSVITALVVDQSGGANMMDSYPIMAYDKSANAGLEMAGLPDGEYNSIWWSQLYKIGQPFKITKIRIPFTETLRLDSTITPKIWIDSGVSSTTLTPINATSWNSAAQSVVIRPQNLVGDNDFWLELAWTLSDSVAVALPITIEYELLDVDTAFRYKAYA